MIYFLGTLQELILPYVRECLGNGVTPSATDYIKSAKERCTKSQSYAYHYEMVTRYAQGIINFRAGIRRNNSLLIKAGRYMTKELFHGRNHPKYQQIEIFKDAVDRVMPSDLNTIFQQNASISKSGCQSAGQGYDFLLEEENKDLQKWIRRGVASDRMWMVVTRSKAMLSGIRNILFNGLNISDEDHSYRKTNLTEAINEWRIAIREYSMLNNTLLMATNGKQLDSTLLSFTSESGRRRTYKVLQFLLHQPPPEDVALLHPVPVTTEEKESFNSYKTYTIQQIDKTISNELQNITDEELRKVYTHTFNKNVLRKKKEVHIDFLMEVQGIVQTQDQAVDIPFLDLLDGPWWQEESNQ